MDAKTLEATYLLFGLLAPLIFYVADLATIILVKKYNPVSQSINELHAVGASSRPYLVASNVSIFSLMLFFGIGVWKVAGSNWALHTIAVLIIAFSVFNFIGLFYPMRVGQPPSKMNVIIGALGVFSLTFAIPFGAFAFNGWFLALSIAISAFFVLLTVLGAWILPKMTKKHTPTIGIQERVMMYTIFFWVALLALNLLKVL